MKQHQWANQITSLGHQCHINSSHAAHASVKSGNWLPGIEFTLKYIHDLKKELGPEPSEKFLPEVQEFADLVESDLCLRYLAAQMISQIPAKYGHIETGPDVRNFKEVLQLINLKVRQCPHFDVPLPVNTILEWWMGTSAGAVFFLNEKVNRALQKILDKWCEFLKSSESIKGFEKAGWMTEDAQKSIHIHDFIYDKNAPNWGFKSWNDFFTRQLKEGARPIGSKDHNIIISPCEAEPYDIQTGVQEKDHYWIKNQPYSLRDMLTPKHAKPFIGGVVYQGFLNAYSYHRWHSPINGKVIDSFVQPGSYYAEDPSVGYDPVGPDRSQGYIAHLAARAIFILEGENGIGPIATIFIGMGEVSSNIITAKPGTTVKKGDQLGYFQFGGSSYAMVFPEGVVDSFFIESLPGPHARILKVHEKVCRLRTKPDN